MYSLILEYLYWPNSKKDKNCTSVVNVHFWELHNGQAYLIISTIVHGHLSFKTQLSEFVMQKMKLRKIENSFSCWMSGSTRNDFERCVLSLRLPLYPWVIFRLRHHCFWVWKYISNRGSSVTHELTYSRLLLVMWGMNRLYV